MSSEEDGITRDPNDEEMLLQLSQEQSAWEMVDSMDHMTNTLLKKSEPQQPDSK